MALSKKLKDLGQIITGNTPSMSDSKNYESDDICFIKPSDIKEDDITTIEGSEFFIAEYARKKARVVPIGSILVTCIGSIGKIGITSKECSFNQQINAIIPNTELVDTSFLAHSLLYKKTILQNLANSAVVPIINKSQFSEVEIKLPSIEDQKSIARRLDFLDNIISLRKQQLSKLDQLVKSRFIEMFGEPDKNTFDFEMASGKNLFKFSSGKFLSDEKRLQNGIPVYGGNGIAWYTDEALIDYPTLIIGRVGAYCGNVRRIDEPVWITDNAIYIKEFKTSNLTLEFLFYLMKFLNFSQFADFSGQPKITQKPLENTLYIIPPLPLQEEFAAFVQQVDNSKSAVKQSLEKLETLKKSLMQEYFG